MVFKQKAASVAYTIYIIILPSTVTLGGAYGVGGAPPSSCDLQWAIGLQQRRYRLFVRKAEVTALTCLIS